MVAAVFAGALVVGPFSGVSVRNLTDTPMLAQQSVFKAAGEGLLKHGSGMKLERRDGPRGPLGVAWCVRNPKTLRVFGLKSGA